LRKIEGKFFEVVGLEGRKGNFGLGIQHWMWKKAREIMEKSRGAVKQEAKVRREGEDRGDTESYLEGERNLSSDMGEEM